MTGHLVGHLVRRGVEHLTTTTSAAQEQYIAKLRQDAELYDSPNSGPDMEVRPQHLLPAFVTILLVLFGISSISYTIGQIVSSLAMIESPAATTVIHTKTSEPAYSDDPDAPLEKTACDTTTDVEVTILSQKPITTSLRQSLNHLNRIGGFFGQWRGFPLAVLYHGLHAFATKFSSTTLGLGLIGEGFVSVLFSVGLARLHMAWTHKVITHASTRTWYSRLPSIKECRPVFRAALVHAVAEQATLLLPGAAAWVLGVTPSSNADVSTSYEALGFALRVGAVILTYVAVGFHILLPASITLARIEALCLPDGETTIVAFDKAALLGNADVTTCAGRSSLFAQTWKSVDRSTKWRLVKLYIKMFVAQVTIFVAGMALVAGELLLLGAERIRVFSTSAIAQLQLMAIESSQNQ
ncbi:hypothetical protein F5Y18DRAFT_319742 [Xylariaceae sp. FL1019]|nr:hypothetical protein F5Y18DRAFT_319742 [Xylariaceae sp. FL1019]